MVLRSTALPRRPADAIWSSSAWVTSLSACASLTASSRPVEPAGGEVQESAERSGDGDAAMNGRLEEPGATDRTPAGPVRRAPLRTTSIGPGAATGSASARPRCHG